MFYSCLAQNELGTEVKTVTLSVTSKLTQKIMFITLIILIMFIGKVKDWQPSSNIFCYFTEVIFIFIETGEPLLFTNTPSNATTMEDKAVTWQCSTNMPALITWNKVIAVSSFFTCCV